MECAKRELMEELKLPTADVDRLLYDGSALKFKGVLNDDSSAVGRRHMAFIVEYEVSADPAWKTPKRGEKSITKLRWLRGELSPTPIWEFEYWSQLCIRAFFPHLADATPGYRIRRSTAPKRSGIICLTGPVGSGKSAATELLESEYGFSVVNSGEILAALLKVPPVPETPRKEFQRLAWQFVQSKNGVSKLANAIWLEVRKFGDSKVLIDGVRQKSTLEALARLAGRRMIGVIYVHTLPDLAFHFSMDNGILDRWNLRDFLDARSAPVEREVEAMLGSADAVIYNWKGINRYRDTVRALMQNIFSR